MASVPTPEEIESMDAAAIERGLASFDAPTLEALVRRTNREYWDHNAPSIPDPLYDRLVEGLRRLDPDNAVLDELGESTPSGPIIEANATMDMLEESLLENTRVVGAHLKERLEQVAANSPHVLEVRGRGLMIGAEICEENGEPSPKLRNRVVMEMFDHGVLILGCGPNTVRFAPPLCLTKEQADCAVDAFAKVIGNFDRTHAADPGDGGASDHGGGA